MDTVEVIEILAATPRWLRSGFAQLPHTAASRAPSHDEWSPLDLLAHLRASDTILAPRIMQVLCRPEAPLAGYDERIWAKLAARAQLSLVEQLAAFEAHRTELVRLLCTLTPAEWALAGQHEIRGTLTVYDIAADLATHEREHRAQFRAMLPASSASAETPHRAPSASHQPGPRGRKPESLEI